MIFVRATKIGTGFTKILMGFFEILFEKFSIKYKIFIEKVMDGALDK